jgi:hypothetical protein
MHQILNKTQTSSNHGGYHAVRTIKVGDSTKHVHAIFKDPTMQPAMITSFLKRQEMTSGARAAVVAPPVSASTGVLGSLMHAAGSIMHAAGRPLLALASS